MPTTIVEDFVTTLDVMFWGMLYPTLAVCPKSAHMRFVHSRGDLVLVLKRHLLDCGRDLWVLI